MRFLVSRRWLAALFALIVFSIACVELGFWQLRRLDQRKRLNATVSANINQPPVPVDTVFADNDINSALYRHVTARGKFDVSQEVLLTGRAFNGRPGSDVLTPLVTADGRALVVNRGFVPFGIDKPGDARALPSKGTVTVTGIILPSEGRGLFGQAIAPTGQVDEMPRIDVQRIGRQVPYAIFPAYLLLDSQQPVQSGTLPEREQYIPELSNGPHLSYAIQWFSFASIAVIAYATVAWRKARTLRREIENELEPSADVS